MNMKKKLGALLSLSVLCASLIGISAATTVNGSSWAKVNYVNLPSGGGTTYRTDVRSKKTVAGSRGSMKAGYSAILYAYGRFIDTQKLDQSKAVTLRNTVVYPELYPTARDVGDILATKVSSNLLEPGRIEVSLKFSANYLNK